VAEGSVDQLVEAALRDKKGLAKYVQDALREDTSRLESIT
jgi:hypothetical protein